MARFTVYQNPNGKGYLLDLQANINIHFYASTLNPLFEIDGAGFIMATQGMAAVPLSLLKIPVLSLEHKQVEIVSAIDLLFQGF